MASHPGAAPNIAPNSDGLPNGWEMAVDQTGQLYFLDHNTKKTTWADPRVNQEQNDVQRFKDAIYWAHTALNNNSSDCKQIVMNLLADLRPLTSITGSSLSRDMMSVFKDRKCCDVVFKLANTEIPAHKNILCARSVYFERMFESGMQESSTGVVDLKDEVDAESFNLMLEYIYSDDICDFNFEKASLLLPLADKYLLDGLKLQCEGVYIRHLKSISPDDSSTVPHTCQCDTCQLIPVVFDDAYKYSCSNLKEACLALLKKLPEKNRLALFKNREELLDDYIKLI